MNESPGREAQATGTAPRSGGSLPLQFWDLCVQCRVQGLTWRFNRLSRLQRILVFSALAALVLVVAGLTAGPHFTGYLGVFGFSMLASALLFIPSGRGAVMIAAALVLNPLAVALLTGVGGALGEITGYALGRSSRAVIKKGTGPGWLTRRAEKHMALSLLAISIIPNPFVDAVGIIAGRLGYPVRRFLVYSIIGKVVQSIVIVYVALWNISLISSWIGVGS